MQANLLELSKQGNIEAIATLLNKTLRVRGVSAQVILKGTCLKVMLEASIVPNQKLLSPCVLKEISNLNANSIETLQIFGRQSGQKTSAWTQTFTLKEPEVESLAQPTQGNESTADNELLLQQMHDRELAQQGDLTAIAAWLNRAIADENIQINISAEGSVLKIVAAADQFLDGQAFAKRIYQELIKLNLTQFETAEVYKQKQQSSYTFLLQSFTLAQPQEPPTPAESDIPAPPTLSEKEQGKASVLGRFRKILK
jgi:hypothetical protein